MSTATSSIPNARPLLPQWWLRSWRWLLLVASLAALFPHVVEGLVLQWSRDGNYSHGFVVPLISGFILWQMRRELREVRLRPSFWGLGIILGSIGVLFLGSLGAELFLARMGFWGTLCGLVVYVAGWQFARRIWFPLFFLLFMIPLPAVIYYQIVFPLQLLASRLATSLLELLNFFPVLREGNVLILPHTTMEVVEACSGIRSLFSLLAVTTAYVYFAEKSSWLRVFLVAMIVPLAIVSNALRVVVAALLTNRYGDGMSEGFVHELLGWLIFLAAMGMMLLLHRLLIAGRRIIRRRTA